MSFTYDSRGRVVVTSDPEGHQTFSWYGGTNGNRSRDSIAGGLVHVYGHDTFGRMTSDSTVGVVKRRMVYDTLNRLIRAFDGVNDSATRYAYDSLRLISVRDPADNSYAVKYNAVGLAVAHTDPAGHSDTLQYDVEGLLRRAVNRRGQAITYAYDAAHRLRAPKWFRHSRRHCRDRQRQRCDNCQQRGGRDALSSTAAARAIR